MSEEEKVVDLDAIAEQYEEKSFFRRMGDMFSGLGKPKNSPEYKIACTELQRLAAPLIAITSVVLFVIVLIVMTAVQGIKKDAIEVTIAEVEQEEAPLEETPEEEPPPDDIEPPPVEEIEIMVDTPNPGPVTEITPVASPPSQQVSVKPATQDSVAIIDSPIKMKSMTGSRTPGSIGAATRGGAGYGDARTEATVMKVLWWLKSTQSPDGSWQNKQGTSGNEIGRRGMGGQTAFANTGFAILTYLAHGEYPGSPSPYRKDFGPVVQKGIDYLVSRITPQIKDGSVNITQAWANANMDKEWYAFLIGTYALCEAYGMTKNPNCKEAATACLQKIIDSQGPHGGWYYHMNPQQTSDDVSYGGWALQALKAGKMAGLKPTGLDECIKKAVRCLKTRNYAKGYFFYTVRQDGAQQHRGLTATACLALQLLGFGKDAEVKAALNFMKDWHPTFEQRSQKDMANIAGDAPSPQYYCYYATQCKYQAGMRQGATKDEEKLWQEWNLEMKKLYPDAIKDLPEKVKDWSGKDHKAGYFLSKDEWTAGAVMDSCLVALQLMVYYRYLPTTQAQKDDGAEEKSSATDSSDVSVEVDI